MWLYMVLAGIMCGLFPFAFLSRLLDSREGSVDKLLPVSLRQARVYAVWFVVLVGARLTIHSFMAGNGYYEMESASVSSTTPLAGIEQQGGSSDDPYVILGIPIGYAIVFLWAISFAALLCYGTTVLVRTVRGHFRPSSGGIIVWLATGFVMGYAAFWGAFLLVFVLLTDLESPLSRVTLYF